jgi:phytoene/squalene synthetase
MAPTCEPTALLSRSITRKASWQTYHTISLLADRDRVADGFRAYAYFRWVDDWLDGTSRPPDERLAFVQRQMSIVGACLAAGDTGPVSPEERIVVDLLRDNGAAGSGLGLYVSHMLAVMAFDADRRGHLISEVQLDAYQRDLAVAVTEAIHYFIGHAEAAPPTPARYLAVTAAHITHMLRDTWADLEAGYFNIPYEFLMEHDISPADVESEPYRGWVRGRVETARRLFGPGKAYYAGSPSRRRCTAALAYAERFEIVLDVIERDCYVLRNDYSGCKTLGTGLRMAASLLVSALGFPFVGARREDTAIPTETLQGV